MHDTPILLIDDEESVLEGIGEFLEDEGYRVFKASDGSTGLEVFRSVKPDLVMTDLRMPGMSGIELISEIRKLKESTPIIVFTGYGSLDTAIDAIHLRVFDFVTKPVDLDALKDILDRARRNLKVARQVQDEMAASAGAVGFLSDATPGTTREILRSRAPDSNGEAFGWNTA